jgi:hypothetical protein
MLEIEKARAMLEKPNLLVVANRSKNHEYRTTHSLTIRQTEIVLEGGIINLMRRKRQTRETMDQARR